MLLVHLFYIDFSPIAGAYPLHTLWRGFLLFANLVSTLYCLESTYQASRLPATEFSIHPPGNSTTIETGTPKTSPRLLKLVVWTRHNPRAVEAASHFVVINNVACLLYWMAGYRTNNGAAVCAAYAMSYVTTDVVLLSNVKRSCRVIYVLAIPLVISIVWFLSYSSFCLTMLVLSPFQLKLSDRLPMVLVARATTMFVIQVMHEYAFEYLSTLALGYPLWNWIHNLFRLVRPQRPQVLRRFQHPHPLENFTALELHFVLIRSSSVTFVYGFRPSAHMRLLRKLVPHRRITVTYTGRKGNPVQIDLAISSAKFMRLMHPIRAEHVETRYFCLPIAFLRGLYNLFFRLPDEPIPWNELFSAACSFVPQF